MLAIVGALVAAARYSSGDSPEPFVLAGDSVAVIDPETDTIVGEIPVGGRPTGPAVGEGSVWVGNRDDNTLSRIDPKSLEVVRHDRAQRGAHRRRGGSGKRLGPQRPGTAASRPRHQRRGRPDAPPASQWPGRWSHLEVGANAVFVCSCEVSLAASSASTLPRRPSCTVRRSPVWMIAYGEGALWAITGWEQDTIERIDPKTNVVERIPLGRIGETHGWRYRMAVGAGAIWLLAPASLWRIDPTTGRFTGERSARPQCGRQRRDRRRSGLGRELEGRCSVSTPTPRRVVKTIRSGLSSTPRRVGRTRRRRGIGLGCGHVIRFVTAATQ